MKLLYLLALLGLVAVGFYLYRYLNRPPSWGSEPAGQAARYPVVLAHGFNAGPDSWWGFNKALRPALEADGHLVFVTLVSPFHSVATRARQLAAQLDEILEATGSPKVNLIGHSMGGLDGRYLISHLGYADRVASMTTIATPHHGTYIADAILGWTQDGPNEALNAFARALGVTYTERDLANNADLRAALNDLSEANAEAFNNSTPDHPHVDYQSWAGLSNVAGVAGARDEAACIEGGGEMAFRRRDELDPLLVPISTFVAHGRQMIPNDGVVSVASARWGRFRGCLPADHLKQVGQVNKQGRIWKTGFDYVRFYRNVLYELAEKGF